MNAGAFLGTFLGKLLDPVGALISGIAGAFCRQWWQTLIVSIVAAAIMEMLLSAVQVLRHFHPVNFALGFAAAEVWATIGYSIGRRIRRRKAAKL